MHWRIRQHAAAGDAVRAIRADGNLRTELPLVRDNGYTLWVWSNILDSYSLSNLKSSRLCLSCQPGIELITPDDAQGVTVRDRYGQSSACKIEMCC
jgi:hypothetical protein